MGGPGGVGGAASPWTISPSDHHHYVTIFLQSAVHGTISGLLARQLLGQSGLPVVSLRAIWDLADMDKDGALNQVEFVVRSIFPVPASLHCDALFAMVFEF